MLIPVVAVQLLLQEASDSTLHIHNQAPSRLLNRFREILTNIVLLRRAQEWYGTYHLLNNYSRQLTSHQVIQLEETRTNLVERFDEEYEIQQQRFTILRQLGILLFKDRACKKSIRLFSIIARHVNMFEHSWIECFQDNCALDLTVRLRIFFHTVG